MVKLPIRIAHPPRPQLEYIDDAYFAHLVRAGYEGLYLQDSPFDTMTGNHGPFKKLFHLISMYDLSRSPQRQRYVDYINEVCRRAARHGLTTHLCCWEPRLPLSAWADTPAAWRGRGGFTYAGGWNFISFCWSEPDAVAYWQAMAKDAFAALPGIAGVHLGVVDNEADFCDETCKKCRGLRKEQQLTDIYRTFAAIKADRPGFRIAIYDWWLPPALLEALPGIVGTDALLIGRSSQGHHQRDLPGEVEDMTQVFDGCGPGIVAKATVAKRLGLRLVDMPAWCHPNEAWYLPAAPDPLHALLKLKELEELGAHGWYDFDCGSTEPGSIHEAIVAWSEDHAASSETLLDRVLERIYGHDKELARIAHAAYRQGKVEFPIAYADSELHGGGFSGRCIGLGLALFGPFKTADMRFVDLGHVFCWFAPFNLLNGTSIPVLLRQLTAMVGHMRRADEVIRGITRTTPAAVREQAAFEIYHRNAQSMLAYVQLAAIHFARVNQQLSEVHYRAQLSEVAKSELENLTRVEEWATRNPGAFNNPCHSLLGWLGDSWPDDDFSGDIFAAKRRSLVALLTE